ncbi:hypothetical protein FJT64_027345 [Amphibalanus amphitrite]|uniref:Uncharacterized protein n=1 Tax=Amphibalanus amphitrite TaxID=1232801 RepID=A0A6A4VVE9_AMPAM|nr:hypothetical protein FJT64_027345 [Amphibalanus amphitrite]
MVTMGRRRAGGGGDSLPQTVRRNNAKNERKTMEAMADTLWASVESGKERRLRLAAERMGRMLAAQETSPAPQEQQEPITVNTESSTVSGEQPLSPTSDGSRSRRSTFNSAVSPLSPQTELDDYFEDVVLAGRQSDVTMAALRGFTASPLSEGLAPGEQLDSLRTEPDLELSEPGTADTLDDGPFSYQDIGDEGTVTPVGDDLGSTPIQTMMQDVRLSSEQLQTEAGEAVLYKPRLPVLYKPRLPVLYKPRLPVLNKPRLPVLYMSRLPVLNMPRLQAL